MPSKLLSAWCWPYFFTGVLLNSLRLQSGLMNGLGSLIIWVACAAFLGSAIAQPWGIGGRWVGSIAGFVIASILTWAIWLGRIHLFYPFPSCRREKCHSIFDYEWKITEILGRVGRGVYRYKCKCGDEYIREGNKFMELLPDGKMRLYKKVVGFHKWADDTE